MRNELERGASNPVLHSPLVVSKGRISARVVGIPARNALLGQFPALVGQIDESDFGSANHVRAVPVSQQLVIGCPDQKVMESRPRHQALDGPAEAGLPAVPHRAELLLGRKPAGE